MALLRLDKYLSDCGVSSRREARALIKSGRVTLDGTAAAAVDAKVDPDSARIMLDGQELCYQRFHYYMLDKPLGVVTATEDRRQQTVLDLLPSALKQWKLFPVGRLDKDTGGLLLLTDDGDFAHRVISPKNEVWKCYLAETEGRVTPDDAAAFAAGLTLKDGTVCLPAMLEALEGCRCLVRVREGKYHQVRRMLASRGKPVISLRRLSIGSLSLPRDSSPGDITELREDDLCRVFMDK